MQQCREMTRILRHRVIEYNECFFARRGLFKGGTSSITNSAAQLNHARNQKMGDDDDKVAQKENFKGQNK